MNLIQKAFPEAYRFMNRKTETEAGIVRIEERIRTIREQATHYTARLNALPGSEGLKQGLENKLAAAVDLENELAEMIRRSEEVEREIRDMIARVENPEVRETLEYRYLYGLPWEEVSRRMYLFIRTVMNYHRRGMEQVEKKLSGDPLP